MTNALAASAPAVAAIASARAAPPAGSLPVDCAKAGAAPASTKSVRLPAAIPARRICLAPWWCEPALDGFLPDSPEILTERSVSRRECAAKTPPYRRGAPDRHPRCSAGRLLKERLPRRLDRRHRTRGGRLEGAHLRALRLEAGAVRGPDRPQRARADPAPGRGAGRARARVERCASRRRT